MSMQPISERNYSNYRDIVELANCTISIYIFKIWSQVVGPDSSNVVKYTM